MKGGSELNRNLTQESTNILSAMEVNEIATRTKAMSLSEKRVVLMNLPTNMILSEIERRDARVKEQLSDIFNILNCCSEQMTLIEIQEVLRNCKEILKH